MFMAGFLENYFAVATPHQGVEETRFARPWPSPPEHSLGDEFVITQPEQLMWYAGLQLPNGAITGIHTVGFDSSTLSYKVKIENHRDPEESMPLELSWLQRPFDEGMTKSLHAYRATHTSDGPFGLDVVRFNGVVRVETAEDYDSRLRTARLYNRLIESTHTYTSRAREQNGPNGTVIFTQHVGGAHEILAAVPLPVDAALPPLKDAPAPIQVHQDVVQDVVSTRLFPAASGNIAK